MLIEVKNLLQILVAVSLLISASACRQTDTVADSSDNQTGKTIKLDSVLYRWEEGKIVLRWADLMDICFEQMYDDTLEMDVDVPRFSDKLLAIDGHEVIAEGYYIPVDETGNSEIVILSAFPFSQCFFCGQAGVESIIDVLVSEPLPKMKTDTKVRFKGKLKLNDRNFDYLIYILENAKLYPVD